MLAHSQLTQVQAWVICPQVVGGLCQACVSTLASWDPKVEMCDAPPPILAPLLKKGFPSPSHAAASLDRGRGSGQKGKCEEFPSACHQSPQAFGVVALRPSAAMEPLETPIKDGILYQQHVKFGKVGTLAAEDNWASTPGPGRMVMGIRVGGSNPDVGMGERPILCLSRRAEPEWALGRPCLIYRWGSQESEGSKNPSLGAGHSWEAC